MMNIQLVRTNSGWMADYNGDAEIMALFGTDILPTAFTAQAEQSDVLRAIKALNPGANVSVL